MPRRAELQEGHLPSPPLDPCAQADDSEAADHEMMLMKAVLTSSAPSQEKTRVGVQPPPHIVRVWGQRGERGGGEGGRDGVGSAEREAKGGGRRGLFGRTFGAIRRNGGCR